MRESCERVRGFPFYGLDYISVLKRDSDPELANISSIVWNNSSLGCFSVHNGICTQSSPVDKQFE
jgi:hypothetical protein